MRAAHFPYEPGEHEAERASNSYLMSMVALLAGLPLPIINLLATVIFFLGNRKGTYFVRWHCTQALVSQFAIFLVNSGMFWWAVYLFATGTRVSNGFIAYAILAVCINVVEMIGTIRAAIRTRKGIYVEWWLFSDLTNLLCKPNT